MTKSEYKLFKVHFSRLPSKRISNSASKYIAPLNSYPSNIYSFNLGQLIAK